MRKLVVFRGHQGSGKSYAIKALGLEEWALSSDQLRSVVSGPVLGADGRMMVNQEVNAEAMGALKEHAEKRMMRGETLVIDTTNVHIGDIGSPKKFRTDNSRAWRALAEKYNYQVAYVDLSNIPLDVAIERQRGRKEQYAVPASIIKKFHKILQDNPIVLDDPKIETLIKGDLQNTHIQKLSDWLEEPVVDLSHYDKIVHIGDLQGCFSVLAGEGGPLADGLRDNNYYIFVGDLLDRGIENGDVMRWFIDNALDKSNVALMYGNHEKHLDIWSRGDEAVSNEFRFRTLPQLHKAGITREDAGRVVRFAKEYLRYTYKGREVFVNHAGLSNMPNDLWRISLHQFSTGTGNWTDDVDSQYASNMDGVYQVHGHRNPRGVTVRANSLSFNLENAVEFGGFLRTCTLDENGWSEAEYENNVYRSLKERLSMETVISENRLAQRKSYPDWTLNNEPSDVVLDADLLKKMRAHDGVKESKNNTFPHIVSLNFTRDVFFNKSWDDIVVKARGLFINRETAEIAGRGYDKFYNINETPETQIDVLLENLKFPVTLYAKENGFLGNLGYDSQTNSLMIASKSTPDSDFAGWFGEILSDKLSTPNLHRIKRYLADHEASITFEVIDPTNDPHIIKYDEANIVLLDIVRRSSDFRRASYQTVKAVGDDFGLDVKTKGMHFKNKHQFAAWYNAVKDDMGYLYNGKPTEGFVIEDSNGYMTKWKSPYYAFWKKMRSQHQRVKKALGSDQKLKNAASGIRGTDWMTPEMVELAIDFNGWMIGRSADTIGNNIIEARDLYQADNALELDTEQRKVR